MVIKNNIKVAVIGSGNGGCAFAGWLSLRGFPVVLTDFEEFTDNLKPLHEQGGIEVNGAVEGFARIATVTSIPKAIKDTQVVLAVIPAFAHSRLARELISALPEDAILLLNPGRTGGALEVYHILSENGRRFPIMEAQTLLFSCRKPDPVSVHIYGIKKELIVSSMPSCRNTRLEEMLGVLIPDVKMAEDIRITSFGNIGAMFHPTIALVNASHIDGESSFEFYKEGVTPSVGQLIEAIDRERLLIARASGVNIPSIQKWLHRSYGVKIDSICQMIRTNNAYTGIMAPHTLKTRYFEEDVPTGLVPLEAFGRLFNIPTPTISSIICIAGALIGQDYRAESRDLERMGITGMGTAEFLRYIQVGRRP